MTKTKPGAKLAIHGGVPVRTRPFAPWPCFDEREREQLLGVLASRDWGGFPAPNTRARQFAQRFAAYHGAKYGVCCANGSISLELSLRAAGVKAGDEVIVPPYTWVATAGAPVHLNLVPVFVDVQPDTYCLDPERIEEAITERTKAIIPVHLGATFADMDRIMEIANKHGLIVIEDCAHAHGGFWRGRGAGSIGHFGSFSFQSSKLMTAGEGGVVLTSNPLFYEKLESLNNCGRKEPGYDSFDGTLFGWNSRISEWQAAVLLAQLARLADETQRREQALQYLAERIAKIPGLRPLPRDERVTTQPAYQFIFQYDAAAWNRLPRERFLAALEAEGVDLDGPFYTPLYENSLFNVVADEWPMIRARYGESILGGKIDGKPIDCPVACKAAYEEAVWMHYPYLMGSREDLDDIVAAIQKVRDHLDELV